MDTLFQVSVLGLLVVQIALIIFAMWNLRRQGLSERLLVLWDMIVLFVPLGSLIALAYFPPGRTPRP
ncbi:MAG: hypothetical protein K8I60_08230 [Anaerolineae bacterium]|nr:hypothetical protein [Anaerolineae bacterium]